MATEYPSRLLLNGGADRLVLNGGADILVLGGNTDYNIDDLAGAGATASVPLMVFEPGPISFVWLPAQATATAVAPSAYDLGMTEAAGATAVAPLWYSLSEYWYPGAGASAEAPLAGAEPGYTPAGATSSGATPVFEPGPIDFTVSLAAGANAGVLAVGNHWEIEYPAVSATAGAATPVFEPGPVFFPLDGIMPAASAIASANMPSHELSFPSTGATAGASDTSLESSLPSAGASAAGTDIVFEPGPIDFVVTLAASAMAGTLSYGNHWEIEYPGVGATAEMGILSFDLSLADAAGATAGADAYSLEVVPASAGASASGADVDFLPGPVFFPLSGVLLAAGANAGVLGPGNHWEIEYPGVVATASGADPVFEPGPISFPLVGTLEGSPATAGVPDYEYEIAVTYSPSVATAGAGEVVYEPGPVDYPLGAAGATAGTDAEGYDVDVYFPAVAAIAGVSRTGLEVSFDSAAGATASVGWNTNLLVLPPGAPIVKGTRSEDYTSITLTWPKVRGANLYVIFRGEGYRSEFTQQGIVSEPTLTFSQGALDPTKSYTFAVQSIDGLNSANGLRSLAVYLPGQNETLNP